MSFDLYQKERLEHDVTKAKLAQFRAALEACVRVQKGVAGDFKFIEHSKDDIKLIFDTLESTELGKGYFPRAQVLELMVWAWDRGATVGASPAPHDLDDILSKATP